MTWLQCHRVEQERIGSGLAGDYNSSKENTHTHTHTHTHTNLLTRSLAHSLSIVAQVRIAPDARALPHSQESAPQAERKGEIFKMSRFLLLYFRISLSFVETKQNKQLTQKKK